MSKNFGVRDRLWLTAKTRMVAETRLNRYSLASHLILSYYALTSIISAIFVETLQAKVQHLTEITIFISIVTFAASLIVYGFKFEQSAGLHRDCYLRLDALKSSQSSSDEELAEKYHSLLSGYPNHTERDYETLVIERTYFNSSPMWNETGDVQYNIWMLLRRVTRVALFYGSILILIAAPTKAVILPLFSQ